MIRALDCTHVEIRKSTVFGDDYINWKGKATISVQATCDSCEIIARNFFFMSVSLLLKLVISQTRPLGACAYRNR